MLSPAELQRYARQIALPELGLAGQERLRSGKVLVVGAGGLGSPVSLYLAAAGVGTLGLVDFDVVDVTNLHRQLLHGTDDVGRRKTDSARDRLRDVNPHVDVISHAEMLSSSNAIELFGQYDVVVDASDNFPTRYLINDASVLAGIPNVSGSVERFEGHVSVFSTRDGPCYRCLFREPPPPELVPTCAEAGVLGVIPGLIGMLQAIEVIKLITGIGDPLIGRLLVVDAKRGRFRTIAIPRDPSCPVCGTRTQTALIDYEQFCGVKNSKPRDDFDVDVRAVAKRLVSPLPPLLLDVREAWEITLATLPGARALTPDILTATDLGLPRDRDLVVYCHHGTRSEQWVALLRARGYPRAFNLRGGIDAWSTDVDSSIPRY